MLFIVKKALTKKKYIYKKKLVFTVIYINNNLQGKKKEKK